MLTNLVIRTSPAVVFTICVVLSAVYAVAVTLGARRAGLYGPAYQPTNDVIGFTYGVFGIIYGIFFAFVVTAVWEDYNRTERDFSREIECLQHIVRDAVGLRDGSGGDAGAAIKAAAVAYAEAVRTDEWGRKPTAKSTNRWDDLWSAVYAVHPTDPPSTAAAARLVRQLELYEDLRRTRLDYKTHTIIHFILWAALIVGAVFSVIIPSFFHSAYWHSRAIVIWSVALILLLGFVSIIYHANAYDCNKLSTISRSRYTV